MFPEIGIFLVLIPFERRPHDTPASPFYPALAPDGDAGTLRSEAVRG